jgi:hypothetical protein
MAIDFQPLASTSQSNDGIDFQPLQTSTAGAFGRAAATGVAPSFGAAGGAEAGAAIGATIPVLGETGLGEIGGAVVGALVGSLLADKAQNAAIKAAAPNTYATLQKYQQQDLKDHPVATALGNIAGGIPAFRLGNPVQAARGAAAMYKIATGKPVTDAEKYLAKGLATQLGAGTAMGVAAPLIQGQKPTIGDVTQSVAQTLLFGNPRFGKVPAGVPDQRTESEDQNAKGIRRDTGQSGAPGQVPQSGQTDSGGNVQQTAPGPPEPVGARAQIATTPGSGGSGAEGNGAIKLQPALLVDGKPVTGGETHAKILERLTNDPNTPAQELEGAMNALADDSKHVFVDQNGKVYSRKEAAPIAAAQGYNISDPNLGLKSEDLLGPAKPEPGKPFKAYRPNYDWANLKAPSLAGVRDAMQTGLTEKDVPRLKQLRDQAGRLGVQATKRGDNKGQKIQMARNIYYSGMIEGASKKGPNFDALRAEMRAALPGLFKTESGGAHEQGVGAMKKGELGEAGNPDVMGVRQATREQQEKAGLPVVAEPGEGTTWTESRKVGQAILAKDPSAADKAVEKFEKGQGLTHDDIAVVRAKYEQVMAEGQRVRSKYGDNSPEAEAYRKEAFKWSDAAKRMQTESHKIFAAQQGETDIDTGNPIALEVEHRDATKKEFTPQQRQKAGKIAAGVQKARARANKAKVTLNKTLVKRAKKAIAGGRLAIQNSAQRIIDRYAKVQKDTPDLKPGKRDELQRLVSEQLQKREEDDVFHNKMIQLGVNPDDARVITMMVRKEIQNRDVIAGPEATAWRKVKDQLDQGETDFDDIRHKVAADMGLPVERVTEMLSKDRAVKRVADEVWKRQQDVRRLKEQAKQWVKEQSSPGYVKALKKIPKILFGLKVGFHGTVALGTHAPVVAFQPNYWGTYVKNFVRMYHMVGKAAYYEQQMQDLVRRGNFLKARRAGLVNDPFQYEDYNDPNVSLYARFMLAPGQRGYAVLKTLRQDMFDQHWNTLPKDAQTDDVAKQIADAVNHATGVVKAKAPVGTNLGLFAPRLLMSRVAWLAVDPTKSAMTFLNWKNASEAERRFATYQLKEKAYVAGTLFSLLAFNQAMLSLVGSNQKVNLDNPMQSDWLKFKVAGMNLAYGNAMVTMARFPARLWQIRESSGGKLKNLIYPDESTYTATGEYVRSQMSPFMSLLWTLWLKSDWQNRPLPNSTQPVPKRLRAQGVQPYTWTEFGLEQIAPIPAEEALREVFQGGMNMSGDETKKAEKALATIGVMMATGARLTDDVMPNKAGQFVWIPPTATAQQQATNVMHE